MITKEIHKICKDDPSLIENYDKAIADKEKWICHHRLELTLDGDFALSKEELIRFGMYYHRPYFELIFLPWNEHTKIHMNNRSPKCISKMHAPKTENHKKSLSRVRTGKNNPMFGKPAWNRGLTKNNDPRVAKYGNTRKERNRYL